MSARSIIASLWSFGVLIYSSGWARQSKAFLCNSRRKDKGKKWCLLEEGRRNRSKNRNRNRNKNKNRNRIEDAVEGRGIYDRGSEW